MKSSTMRRKAGGKTLFEPLPDMDPKRQATSRLIRHIEQRCLKQTFLALARERGGGATTRPSALSSMTR